ncbi:MFS transporter [Streptomyces sp. NBC_01669]|uniref:MFS transporter n=1 Tax=Streptomyces sp. NBC_01669 TaxID=2975909 RepID=UPI00224E1441|nr:MFS transporter [Streptomyces sp. NBC_01669]MCX4538234.1 MHS family MFS transporter [Streptomyces sp. NBC_01669]
MRKKVAIAVAGSAIEWFDFFIYATASALVLNRLFFPDFSDSAGTLLSLSTFAVGFLVRPLGAALFGHFGDRYGRKPALVTAMTLMGVTTVAIGVLPTYASVGALAPVLLVLMRLIQGLALGGQWGGAVLIVTESAPANRRGFYGSFAQIGVPLALIASTVVFLILSAATSEQAFLSWGWRVPFLLSLLLVGIGIFTQSRLEGVDSEQDERPERMPLLELMRDHWKETLLAAGATLLNAAAYYLLAVYVLTYFANDLGFPKNRILTAVIISAAVSIFTIPAAALLSDRIGRRKTYFIGGIGLGLWVFPMFWLINTGQFVLAAIALIVAQIFFSFTYGPAPALFSEMFGQKVRYSGVSVGYQIGAVGGGAFAPLIATSLYDTFGSSNAIALYMTGIAAISLVAVRLISHPHVGKTEFRDSGEETSVDVTLENR